MCDTIANQQVSYNEESIQYEFSLKCYYDYLQAHHLLLWMAKL